MFAVLHSNDTGYRLLLLGHLLFVIVGFGSTFVWAFLGPYAQRNPGAVALGLSDFAKITGKVVTTYSIWIAGAFGLALGIAADYMDQLWLQISLVLYLVAVLFSYFVHVRNLDRMNELGHQLASGPPPGGGGGGPPPQVLEMQARGKAAARNGGILHILFFVILILMIWKPT
jgi:uncharacterized membrane protein